MPASQNAKYKPVEYVPLTSAQKWLMGELPEFKRPGWVTIDFLVKTKVRMDEVAMEKSIDYLLRKYENLRVRISSRDGQLVQELYPLSEADAFAAYDFSREDPQQQAGKVKQICVKTREWLLPERGNLMKILFFKLSPNEGRIWFCMHHVISDFVSVQLLTGDFITTYNSIIQGKELKYQFTREYSKWLYLVEGYARDVLLPSELEYWVSLPWEKAQLIPSDYPGKFGHENTIIDAINNKKLVHAYQAVSCVLDREATFKLLNKYGNDFEYVLIAAFFLAIARQRKINCLDISASSSGRNLLPPEYGVMENKLAGYLAMVRVLLLTDPGCADILPAIGKLVEQIKNIPNQGLSFRLIGDQMKNQHLRSSFLNLRKNPQIFFNYLGRTNTGFGSDQYEIVDEDTGQNMYDAEIRNSILDCIAGINLGRLQLSIGYIDEYLEEKTAAEILELMTGTLHEIVAAPKVQEVA